MGCRNVDTIGTQNYSCRSKCGDKFQRIDFLFLGLGYSACLERTWFISNSESSRIGVRVCGILTHDGVVDEQLHHRLPCVNVHLEGVTAVPCYIVTNGANHIRGLVVLS